MAYDKTIEALRRNEQSQWIIGDALRTEITYHSEWDALAKLLQAEGIEHTLTTLKAYRRVATAYPVSERISGASFAAHQAALTMGNAAKAQTAIRKTIERNGTATRTEVLATVREMKGRASNATSTALVAWRDLTRGLEAIANVPDTELVALLTMDAGKYAGQATQLSRDLAQVSMRVSKALAEAEKAIKAQADRKAAAVAKVASKAPTAAPKAKAPAAAPKVARLGKGRGQG